MKTYTLPQTHKGEFYSAVAFCEMDGGYGEYRHTNKVEGTTSYEVVDRLDNGSYRLKVMTEQEYKKYKEQ